MTQRALVLALAAAAFTAAPTAAQDVAGTGLAGTWQISFETERGTVAQTLLLTQEGTMLMGTVGFEPIDGGDSGSGPKVELADGAVMGSSFTFTITVYSGQDFEQQLYAGTFDGDTIRGIMQSGSGGVWQFAGARGP